MHFLYYWSVNNRQWTDKNINMYAKRGTKWILCICTKSSRRRICINKRPIGLDNQQNRRYFYRSFSPVWANVKFDMTFGIFSVSYWWYQAQISYDTWFKTVDIWFNHNLLAKENVYIIDGFLIGFLGIKDFLAVVKNI